MKDIKVDLSAFALALAIFAVAWGFKGCWEADQSVLIEREKTKQIIYQWKSDSISGRLK